MPDGLGDEEVPELVDEDEREQAADGDQAAQPGTPAASASRTVARAAASASRTCSRALSGSPEHASSARSTSAGMSTKRQRAGQERRDGLLVGRVQGARREAAGEAGRAGQREAAERLARRPARTSARARCVRSRRGAATARAARVGERVGDRDAHVGQAEVREQRAVAQPHERVHDRLRVHDDLDALVRARRTASAPR